MIESYEAISFSDVWSDHILLLRTKVIFTGLSLSASDRITFIVP